ncbi:MAG TPA: MFS transporter [Dehalococcoidia bacterium]
MNPDERRIMTYVAMAHGLAHILELTYPAMLTRIEDDFGIRAVVTGGIATMFGWAFGASAIPAGFLADRLGSRQVLVYAFSGSAVMAVLVGLSPNEWWLGAALLGLGLTSGLYHPAGISLVAQGIRQRGMGLGFHGVAGNVGQAMAPAIAIGLAVLVDWRLAFFFVGGLSALLALVMATTRINVRTGSETVDVDAAEEAGDQSTKEGNRFVIPLLLVYAAFIVSGMVYRGAITYLPKHLEDFVNDDFGGAFVTVALLTGAVGQLIGGALSQRYRLEPLAPIICLLTVPPLVLTGVVTGWALVVIASAFVFFYFAAQPLWTGLIADYSPPGAVGRSYGFSFFAGFGLGGTGGVIAGAFVDIWDTQAAFLGLSAIMAGSFLIAMVLWVLAERRRQPAPGEGASGAA